MFMHTNTRDQMHNKSDAAVSSRKDLLASLIKRTKSRRCDVHAHAKRCVQRSMQMLRLRTREVSSLMSGSVFERTKNMSVHACSKKGIVPAMQILLCTSTSCFDGARQAWRRVCAYAHIWRIVLSRMRCRVMSCELNVLLDFLSKRCLHVRDVIPHNVLKLFGIFSVVSFISCCFGGTISKRPSEELLLHLPLS